MNDRTPGRREGAFAPEEPEQPSLAAEVGRAALSSGRHVLRSMALARLDNLLVMGYIGVLGIGAIVVLVVVSILVGGVTAVLFGVLRPEPGTLIATALGVAFLVFWVGGTVLGIVWMARTLGRRLDRAMARSSQAVHALAGDDGGGFESEAQERRRRTVAARGERGETGRARRSAASDHGRDALHARVAAMDAALARAEPRPEGGSEPDGPGQGPSLQR